MTQQQLAAALGVSRQTLYAYVSRGLIAAHPDPQNTRRSLYSAENIQSLKQFETEYRARLTEYLGQLASQVSESNNYVDQTSSKTN